jgi:hypothetical protein
MPEDWQVVVETLLGRAMLSSTLGGYRLADGKVGNPAKPRCSVSLATQKSFPKGSLPAVIDLIFRSSTSLSKTVQPSQLQLHLSVPSGQPAAKSSANPLGSIKLASSVPSPSSSILGSIIHRGWSTSSVSTYPHHHRESTSPCCGTNRSYPRVVYHFDSCCHLNGAFDCGS